MLLRIKPSGEQVSVLKENSNQTSSGKLRRDSRARNYKSMPAVVDGYQFIGPTAIKVPEPLYEPTEEPYDSVDEVEADIEREQLESEGMENVRLCCGGASNYICCRLSFD